MVWRIGGYLAAASIGLAVILSFTMGRTAVADVYADAAKAGEAWFRCVASLHPLFPESAEHRALLEELPSLRERRDRARAAYTAETSDFDPLYGELLHVWQAYYCALRDLGLRDQAEAECRAAIEFTEHNPTGRKWDDWRAVYLDGLGGIHALFGEYDAAERTYLDSIVARRALGSAEGQPEPSASRDEGEGDFAHGIIHVDRRLVMLSLAQNDLGAAQTWQQRAAAALAGELRRLARLQGRSPSAEATVWDLYQSFPPAFREAADNAQLLVHVRIHLIYEARLRRLGGTVGWTPPTLRELDGAQIALDRAASLPDRPLHDEYRVPLILPIEQARLSIARGDYRSALIYLDQADRKAGPSIVPDQPHLNKPAAGPMLLAELALLRGVALLGVDSSNVEGVRLVTAAARLPERLAASLPPDRRAAFLQQFKSWRALLRQAGEPETARQGRRID